jgi:hypothetical protein
MSKSSRQTVARNRQVYIELVVEALLIAIFLPKERTDTYRYRKYNRWIVLPIPSFSWSCLTEPLQLVSAQLDLLSDMLIVLAGS